MYCYVDESGHTGNNLFDLDQPNLYYGLLTSKKNLNVIAKPLLGELHKKLCVKRLHAAELGVKRLSRVAKSLENFARHHDIRFSFYMVAKTDHAVISFFDQVFDSFLNPAVRWDHYNTPLRYPLLLKLAILFDEETAKSAWTARVEANAAVANAALQKVYAKLLERIHILPDERSRNLISDALNWAARNPDEISYHAGNKDIALQISPSLVGFQQVLAGIAMQSLKQSRKVREIVVDRQSEFNHAQDELAQVYRHMTGIKQSMGPGMPEFDMRNMPAASPKFLSSEESAGLELVDVVLWVAQRDSDGKTISNELLNMLGAFAKRGQTDEVSLAGLDRRWSFLANLPAPDTPISEDLQTLLDKLEGERIEAAKI